MAKIHIGTSGWVYGEWQEIFYPEDLPQREWLEYYSQRFKTVEVNSTFYHQMKPSTFSQWRQKVPKDFVFAVKANRFITHIKRLLDCGEPLERLLEQVKGLGGKLGPILFQLPPRWKADTKRLETFLVLCSQFIAHGNKKSVNGEPSTVNRFVFEFRDVSWLNVEIFKILRNYNTAAVINDSNVFPKTEEITADFVYIRLHGPASLYSSEYSKKELAVWSEKIKNWLKTGFDVYAYFNNDVGGYAVKNARTLIQMIS